MFRLPQLTIFFLVIFGLSYPIVAQTQSNISDEKRKLIAQLLSVLKLDKSMEEMTDTILKGMDEAYTISFDALVDKRTEIPEADREKIKAQANKSRLAFSEKFRKRLPGVVDYPQYIQESVYPLYDRFYSEQELKDLIAFYTTPTGQKVLATLPQLIAQSQADVRRLLVPKLVSLVDEILKEDVDAARPSANTTDSRPSN